MTLKHLIAVEKMTSLLAAVLLLASILFLPRHYSFSLGVGAALMVVNAWLMRRTAVAVGPVLQQKPGLLVLLFNFKLLILALLIFLAMRFLDVAPVPFVVGISILPVAILIVALRNQLSPAEASRDEETHG